MNAITFGLLSPEAAVPVLAVWECAIGLGQIFRVFMRATLLLLFVQMLGTFMPVVLYPAEVFTRIPARRTWKASPLSRIWCCSARAWS